MKKLILFILLIPSLVFASGSLTLNGSGIMAVGTQTTTGQVTGANLKVSYASGKAFVDFSEAVVLADPKYIGALLVIENDDTEDQITGYIKAVGTGETFGDEKLSDPAFEDDEAWDDDSGKYDVNITNPGKATATGTGTNNGLLEAISVSQGGLYRLTTTCDSVVAGTYRGLAAGQYLYFTATGETGTKYWYATATGTNRSSGIMSSSFTGTFTDISLKQVLTPAATGVTITSTSDGAIYNWTSMDSSFLYSVNETYTYAIYWIPKGAMTVGN